MGVTGPSGLNPSGSNTRRYIDPLNSVMPAMKSDGASLLRGAREVERMVTPEWMSLGALMSYTKTEGVESCLILSSSRPVCNPLRIRDVFF
jgi:hypothetical protein